jgi:FkbM family methyltransferase
VSGCAAASVAVGLILVGCRRLQFWGERFEASRPQNSQFEEEWIIRDFGGKRNGVFVDIGAATIRLRAVIRDRLVAGLAVEPLQQFEDDYVKHRPRTRFRPFFVSDRSNEEAKIYFLWDRTRVTSSEKSFTQRYGRNTREITSRTITLNDLLEAEGMSSVDFISMDIELAEPKALAGFDIRRYRPALVCIEAHPEVRQQILDYFARNGYVVLGRYLRADRQNLYFAPLQF